MRQIIIILIKWAMLAPAGSLRPLKRRSWLLLLLKKIMYMENLKKKRKLGKRILNSIWIIRSGLRNYRRVWMKILIRRVNLTWVNYLKILKRKRKTFSKKCFKKKIKKLKIQVNNNNIFKLQMYTTWKMIWKEMKN